MSRPGFFDNQTLKTSKHTAFTAYCGKCGLARTCKSPKMKPFGLGRKGILVIAEAPGEHEDEVGRPLVGKAGMRLESGLADRGIDMKRDCWRTNAIICHPPKNKTPNTTQILACQPNLSRTIKQLNPRVILLLGSIAIEGFMRLIGMDEIGYSSNNWSGLVIPLQKFNCWVIPTLHPSYLLRKQSPISDRMFDEAILKCSQVKGRPWRSIPNYEDKVELVYNERQIEAILRDTISHSEITAFDYETNAAKPEYTGADIKTCSLCVDGRKTFAFPLFDNIRADLKAFLRSPVKKVGQNIKFEHRFSKKILKTEPEPWYWDTMLAAHVLDYRTGMTGLKFQTFARFGLLPYDKHIEHLLESEKGDNINRIDQIPMNELLLYNGMDSYFTYRLMLKQKKEMKDGVRC
jgi:uracil-DNA glycosylase